MPVLKGHQIIGELRRITYSHHDFTTYWRVTRSLVSYDLATNFLASAPIIEGSPDHWWVTTKVWCVRCCVCIEGSPDHWWVTTPLLLYYLKLLILKGHQIIGELRRNSLRIDKISIIEGSPDHWWVTTKHASYIPPLHGLKGHQIIGELRLHTQCVSSPSIDWRVTRSLVSYDWR